MVSRFNVGIALWAINTLTQYPDRFFFTAVIQIHIWDVVKECNILKVCGVKVCSVIKASGIIKVYCRCIRKICPFLFSISNLVSPWPANLYPYWYRVAATLVTFPYTSWSSLRARNLKTGQGIAHGPIIRVLTVGALAFAL